MTAHKEGLDSAHSDHTTILGKRSDPFERFTEPARQVVVLGQQEARSLGHSWIGTEHLLLGVLAQPDSPGVSTLTGLGITLDRCRVALRHFHSSANGVYE